MGDPRSTQISNDGKTLAFVRRVRTKSVLYLQNIETGEEWPVFDQLEKDQMEAWTVFGVYSNYAWMPDDKHIIIWGKGGKIWKVNTETSKGEIIPFTANATHKIYDAVRFQQEVAPDNTEEGIEKQVVSALKSSSFNLLFQPLINLKGDDKEHYETLLRLPQTNGDEVSAGDFLNGFTISEDLKRKIDRWVIEYYFSWLNNNPQHLEELSRVSINLSGDSLADQDLKLFVLNAFEKYQIPHQKVCFDIGESLAVMQMDETLEFIDTFQKLGCLIALDDFGMGASSFHNLKQLPVQQIKIDGNFIKDMLVEPINLVMVNSIKEVAKAMNIETVAEFVESTEIMVELGKMGIDFAQGNGVATPQALTEFTPHR